MLNKYLLICIAIIIGIFGISLVSSYTPPLYSSVNFTLTTPYTPPLYSSVNFTLTAEETSNTCTYSGIGDWRIQIEDNCTINNNALGANKIIVNGTCGTLIVNGTTTANEIHRTPTAKTGCYQILVNANGMLGGLK